MLIFEHFSLKKITPVAWKNGGGTTREIACVPNRATMADFDWRVSVAEVSADGAFSIFENVDRSISLLDGQGMELLDSRGGLIHALTLPHAPYAFAGEVPIFARLLNGPTTDFNVMVRRGKFEASVDAVVRNQTLALPKNGALFVTHGQWNFQGQTVCAGHGLVWRDAPVQTAQLVAQSPHGGRALFVSIQRTIAR